MPDKKSDKKKILKKTFRDLKKRRANKTKADKKRIPEKRKDGTKRPKSEHSDLYTDEDPKGTIKGLGFKDVGTAKNSVAIIEKAKRPHKHKVQATMAMEQRSRFAAKNAKDPAKKKNLSSANKIYKGYLEKLKKRTQEKNKEKA